MANSAISAAVQATIYDGNWYGVAGKPAATSPDLTRIGSDMDYHADLPIHSLMKACLLNDDGSVNYYLDPSDWTKKAVGAASKLDGTDGQVMIEVPEHYYLDWNDLDVQRFGISLDNISGWNHFHKSYIGAYKAVAERSTKKLCSLISLDTNYRGGNNDATNDANDKTLLGKCVTALPIQVDSGVEDFRQYAQNRGSIWHPITWKLRSVINRFFLVEFATKNSQKAVNGDLDANGYKQGGLGNGVTTIKSDLASWNGRYPCVPEGQSNSLASGSGEVAYNIPFDVPEEVKICRYRGIENIFGHIMELNDGLVVKYNHDNSQLNIYSIDNPIEFTSSDETKGTLITTIDDGAGPINTVLNNYLFPLTYDGSNYTTYFCDSAHYSLANPTYTYLQIRSCGYAGGGVDSAINGLFWIKSEDRYTLSIAYIGSRLCCHPNGY